MRLNLGCGQEPKREGVIGLDKMAGPTVDVVHDCTIVPWHFPDESFEGIIAWQLFEHLPPWTMLDVMNECWRVLRTDGLLKIGMPAAGSFGFYQDPTHCHTWNEATPRYFDPQYPHYKIYQPKPWTVLTSVTYPKALPQGIAPGPYNAGLRIILRKRMP